MTEWPTFTAHRCPYLGQGVTCEKTPEGGTVCSDGTYHPPGCPTLPPVRAEEAGGKFPTTAVVAGLGGAAALAAILLFTGK